MRMEEASPAVLPMPAMGRVFGYSFEPEFSEEECRRMEESPVILPERRPNQGGLDATNGSRERPDHRLSLTWCSCQFCSIMLTVKECLCFKEMNILKPLIGGPCPLQCITLNEDFMPVCLNRAVVRAVYATIAEMKRQGETVAIRNSFVNR